MDSYFCCLRPAIYDSWLDPLLYRRLFRDDVRLYHERCNHTNGYRRGSAWFAVLAQPDPSAWRHGFPDPGRDLPPPWVKRIPNIPSRFKSRADNHQGKIHPPQQGHDDLALGDISGAESAGDPFARSRRHVNFRLAVP